MKYAVTVDGQTYQIEVCQDGKVRIDGKLHAVGLRSRGPQASEDSDSLTDDASSRFSLSLDQRTFDAIVDPSSGEASWSVTIGGRAYEAKVQRLIEPVSSITHRSTGRASDGRIMAPLPGLVLDVLVAPGQRVRAGEVLILLESMKMQMEVRAPFAGTVSESHTQPGQEVAEGQLLVLVSAETPELNPA